MKTLKNETWLPIFPGFYNTLFEPDESNEIEDINSLRKERGLKEISFDDVDFDYDSYRNEISLCCVKFIEEKLKKLGIIKKIIFQEMHSPNFYNYSNDSINIEVEYLFENLSKYVNNNKDKFCVYLKKEYTSRPGFMSFYSTSFDEWSKDTENFTQFDNEHFFGSILKFICLNEEISEDDMFEYCQDFGATFISATNYDELLVK